MALQTTPEIQLKIKGMQDKNNYYVNEVLDDFIQNTLTQIKRVADVIQLDVDRIEKAYIEFLSRLEKINFLEAYAKRFFKRVDPNDFPIEKDSFEKYIYKQIPSLTDTNGFVSEVLGVNDRKQEILSQLKRIKSTVNEYTKNNKKSIVQDFNTKIDELVLAIHSKPYFDCIEPVKLGLKAMLDAMQTEENRYYSSLRFFAASRQRNSSLQPKINAARELLANLDLENIFADKAKTRLPGAAL